MVKVSIVIPCYNEELAIGDTIKKIQGLAIPDSEIIVVDDGSSDNSALIAKETGVTVISHPYNIGNGASVKSGIRAARGEKLIFLDGDGQHPVEVIPQMLSGLERFHMVVGARNSDSETYWHRRFANKVYNLFASLLASFKIQDLTSGFRAIRAVDAKRFCDLLPNGFSYPTTITLAFLRSGRSVNYLPIKAVHRKGKSKIKIWKDGVLFLMVILKIALAYSPLRVFVPLSLTLFALGMGRYIYTYSLYGQFTNMSHLLINTSVIIFMLGLVAEQVTSLRLEKQ